MTLPTRACGCPSGWTMWTPSTSAASSKVLKSPGRQPTCRGMCARCTCGTQTGTSSESAGELRRRSSGYNRPNTRKEPAVNAKAEEELIALANDPDQAMVENDAETIGRYMAEDW